jgi:8-oxo-dGTP pyrophosphatase MutT (NUDIX family)
MSGGNMFCNNCGEKGHVFKSCKYPIISCGILLVRGPFEPLKLPVDPRTVGVLMVKRKDSMAYMEFIRGKYDVANPAYIGTLLKNMTKQEHQQIIKEEFDTLWTRLWGEGRDTRSTEFECSKEKYYAIDRPNLITLNPTNYTDPEWGVPKGRRAKGETDIDCAMREFEEETNIDKSAYIVRKTIVLSETFKGTNNVEYQHTYFLATLKSSAGINLSQTLTSVQRREISEVSWKSLSECKACTRPHYSERIKIFEELGRIIATYESVGT